MKEMIGQKISHYSIMGKLGEGGMGVVYKAEDLKLGRSVAIKFLPSHLATSEESKARFMREAKSAAVLNHPNILGIYEIDEEDSSLFLVMEYVDGETLKSYIPKITKGTGIPVPQAIDWIEQIANGLRIAHNMNIVHRDIKTENIMITKDGRLKIMDFGLAKLKNQTGLTKTGTSLGTLSYMSPEQSHGISADNRSDIWSLGVVFYEILTGELPFKSEHEAGLFYIIANELPATPNLLNKKIPHQIDAVVMKMLEKEPDKRFQNIDELLKALNEAKNDILNISSVEKEKAIVVLPFDNISPDTDSDYFTDGLTEELIANLSKLKDIRLVPRTTSMRYKGTNKDIKTIGRELGTRYILAGSVRKFQDNLRITVELIDVDKDSQLWAETFKGKLADVFDIQEKVSKEIVDALRLKLSPTEKVVLEKRSTLNAEAFDLYLRARDFLYRMTKSNIHFAIQLFQKAIEVDPRYASAYAGLSESYAYLFLYFERNKSLLDKAIEASLKAMMYDATLSEAYAALALAHYNGNSLAEATIAGEKAVELDPNNFTGIWILGRIYHSTDRDKEAVELYKKVIALNPDFYSAYMDLCASYEKLGFTEQYNKILQKSAEAYPRHLSQHPDDARAYIFFATVLVQLGRIEEGKINGAKALELSPDDALMQYNGACFYARLNEKKLAIEFLEKAIHTGWENYEWMKRDPDLDLVRNEPEYLKLIEGK
ncbi:MAG: protein kinase domain-containing protein [Ignavibacteriaceae bacterium]